MKFETNIYILLMLTIIVFGLTSRIDEEELLDLATDAIVKGIFVVWCASVYFSV